MNDLRILWTNEIDKENLSTSAPRFTGLRISRDFDFAFNFFFKVSFQNY